MMDATTIPFYATMSDKGKQKEEEKEMREGERDKIVQGIVLKVFAVFYIWSRCSQDMQDATPFFP